ncbi:RND efflux system, multidrug efflux transporter [Deferribacter desulfuricans SSM1]|uniref:RND efflux system, multidrug efflux transporter n=1 Tax=Deferribacter desulfuricans (strain DSM 14783 / JCM 11476 / NBRC 101012 / SSM1) TaxID=639282 RepID=D3PE85_DEFDS|nr:efflux RND transporter permease subunit [Deferribacter desulfuricans]BAI80908.1 RND efflux system, multidrug efflux transporter [Deferribacter desulfuricans SSM1]
MFEFFYKRPYLLYSVIAALFIMGVVGLITMPKNLFPDSDRPKVIVVSKVPGATPAVVAATVSKPIEEEVSTLALVREVSSINMAGVSVVTVEFEYKKGLDAAAVDVNNAINKVKAKLPQGVNPAIYTAGSFTLPVDVFALSPKDKTITVADIRKIVESDIKPALLRDSRIGNVEVFGGYQGAITINIDPLKLKKMNIPLSKIGEIIYTTNKDIPVGFTISKDNFYTITIYGERDIIERLKQLPVAPNITLSQIADIKWDFQKRFAGYLGNGKESIAVAVQRAPGGSVLDTSTAAREIIDKLKNRYKNINFELTDTQRILINTANRNMLEALRDAIIFTLIVILLFLGNIRAIIAALISIPMVFFSTLAIIWMFGGELNIVIYTAIILALGMLVDDAVVVLENIERHLSELKNDLETSIVQGTKEVIMPVFAGTVATSIIMVPFLFVGDFPQKIFRPLISTLLIALAASYFLSITFIPHFSKILYRKGHEKTKFEKLLEKIYQNTFGRLVNLYLGVLKFSNGNRLKLFRKMILIVPVIMFFLFSLRNIMPTIGGDLMPPMDTGIIKVHLKFSSNETTEQVEKRLADFVKWLHSKKEVVMSSIAVGSEPGILSIGSGSLPTEVTMTINCVDRFHRKKSIWELEDEIRTKLRSLKNVKDVDVYDFGATALSSIKAPLDVRLFSEDYNYLPSIAHNVVKELYKVKGLRSVNISWDNDFVETKLIVDENKTLAYGITPLQVAMQLPLKGVPVSINGNLHTLQLQFLRLYSKSPFEENPDSLKMIPINTPKGTIPLSQIAKIKYDITSARIERDNMLYSIDVNGYRAVRPVSMITEDSVEALKNVDHAGVIVSQEGDIKQMKDSFSRMIKAIGIGVVLLLMALIAIYRTVILSFVMIFVLPLAMIGAAWGMLIFNKPRCMPSLVGILLLFGIIIKNSVLLVDFYQEFRAKGESAFEAALESVRVRFRPVFMTAFGTIAGMLPIAFERAVGLERLSPLADVAVGGLLIGTILTLIYIPMFAYISDRKK